MFIPVEEIINKYEQARPGSEKNSLPSCSLFSSSYLNLPFENKGFVYLRTIIGPL